MIDINEVLRQAAEAGKFPPKPSFTEVYRGVEKDLGTGQITLHPRRRPDGVWEMPE